MMKIQPSDRQGGKIRPACLSLYYTTLSIRIFITVNRTSVIKAVSSFKATLASVTFYNKFWNHFNLPEGPFLFYRLYII